VRDPLNRWTETLYDALNRPYETIRNYENGDPTCVTSDARCPVDASNPNRTTNDTGWTDGSDTDLISFTSYHGDGSVDHLIDNYIPASPAFSVAAPQNNTVTQYGYDPLGRLAVTVLNADSSQSTHADTNRSTVEQYDPATGRLAGEQDALGRWSSSRYDGLGRVVQSIADCTDAAGSPLASGCAPFDPAHPDRNVATGTRYDALGRAYETTDALGRVAHTDYDGLGRTIDAIANYVSGGAIDGHTNVTTRSTYDGLGELVTSTDANGNATTYGYDALGDRTSMTDPRGRAGATGYDGTGAPRPTAG